MIETALGRIGVGICFENLSYEHLQEMQRASADLMSDRIGMIDTKLAGGFGEFNSSIRKSSTRMEQ